MKLSFVKTPGGKNSQGMLKWIISNFPHNYDHVPFLEVFGGGISVTLNKSPSPLEAINDIYYPNYCLYKVFRDAKLRIGPNLEYSQCNFDYYKQLTAHSDEMIAEREYVLRNMSRGGMKKDFAKSNRLRGGRMGDENAFINKVAQLPQIQKRLKHVQIFNEDAIIFMKRFNTANTFAYLDPPYLHETRVSKKLYENEMTYEQHAKLIEFLNSEWKGLYLLSGYDSGLYSKNLKFTKKVFKEVPNHMGQTKTKSRKIEVLWRNY